MKQLKVGNVKRVVSVSSNVFKGCDHCDFEERPEFMARSVNHYINDHGYQLLHVGPETTNDENGGPWHSTVAVLGHDNPPKERQATGVLVVPGVMDPDDWDKMAREHREALTQKSQ